jgi:hypothetical protein
MILMSFRVLERIRLPPSGQRTNVWLHADEFLNRNNNDTDVLRMSS